MDNSNFYSIDRLVEFGLSLAISQQMVNSMNQAIKSMYIPGSISSIPTPHVFYVVIDKKPVGPLGEYDFMKMIESGKVTKDTLAWMPGMQSWQPVETIPAMLKVIALTPPAL